MMMRIIIFSYFGFIKNLINIAINDANRMTQFNCNEFKYFELFPVRYIKITFLCVLNDFSVAICHITFDLIIERLAKQNANVLRGFWLLSIWFLIVLKHVNNIIINNRIGSQISMFNCCHYLKRLEQSWFASPLIGINCMGLLAATYEQFNSF